MKFDFKKAAQAVRKNAGKGSTLIFAFSAAGFAYGGYTGAKYYTKDPEKAAYVQCIEEKKPCTPEQMGLAESRIKQGMHATVWLMVPQMWVLMGLGYRREEKHREKQKELMTEKYQYLDKYNEEMVRNEKLEQDLGKAQAQLAPYLADEKRKTDTAAEAAAKQQLNQMAQDATTLQGQIKVGKKISIKQTPPTTPQQP